MKLILIFILLSFTRLWSQGVNSDFSIKPNGCLGEQLKVTNLSVGAIRYEWDFCSGDFEETPNAEIFLNSYGGYGTKVEIVEQDGNYFGFFFSKGSRKLFRLDFGDNVNGQPLQVDLGGLGINSSNWQAIEIVKEDSNYFGFFIDFNILYRCSFGESLTNAPSSIEIIYSGEHINAGIDLAIVQGLQKFVFVVSFGNDKLLRFNFDSSYASSVSSVTIDTIIINGSVGLSGLSFLNEEGVWYCLASSSATNQIYKMSFVNGLSDIAPLVSILAIESPSGISIVNDNGKSYVFVQSRNSSQSIFKLTFENRLNNDPTEILELKAIGLNGSGFFGFSMHRAKSDWLIFSTELTGSNIYKISFPSSCFSNTVYSTEFQPSVLTSNPGFFSISLTVKDSFGNQSTQSKDIEVFNNQAPDISFSNLNKCSNNDIIFNSTNSSNDITDHSWSFGDTQTSILPNPTHQYVSAGEYNVQLNVTSTNGCSNFTEKNIKIYDPPTSLFDLPSGLVCTNNEFTFTNNTVDNFDGNLTYEWLVNDVQKATSRDFKYLFTSEGDQQVKLRTSIPGCSDELAQTLFNVQLGPVVDFSFTGKCEDETIMFTNASSGSISGYQWDFGNGEVSTDQNPSEIYTSYGNYSVSLGTTSINGCVSTITKPASIYSKPQTNFSIDLPPFACSGTPSQFNDLTPPMPDSNITSWAWSFGDPTNGNSSQKNPLYTYSLAADYQVSLTTTSNFGCSNFIQKSTTIYPSPQADFSWMAACLNQPTYFLDASTGDIKSWLWSIQSNTYLVKNPVHTFKSVSSYPVLLTVTGTNNCISQALKNVNIPVPVVPDFSSSSTCATKPSVFDEITKGGADPAVSWSWTFASQGSGTGSPTQHIFPSSGNYSVSMNTTRQSGCIYSVTKTIPIVESPKAKFTVFLESGGAPFTVTPSNESTNATKYLWKPGDPNQSNSSLFSPSFTYNNLGDYILELEASNELGCKDYLQQLIKVVIPQINAAIADFRLEKIPGSDNYSSVVTIENKSNVALVNPAVDLDLSGKATIRETIEAIIKPNELFPYTFKASIVPQSLEFACAEVKVNADDYAFDNRQCVNLLDDYVSRIPYPNPASNELMLEWINNNNVPMDLVIYNASGQAIISRKYTPTLIGLNQVKLDISGLAAGIYFVSYNVENNTQNFRFSIVR